MKTEKYTIGIVEDSKVVGEMISWQLQQNPEYGVQLFQSGEELLEAGLTPDVLVLDYHLDGENKHAMNGLEIAKQLNDVPIVVMSSQKKVSIAIDLLNNGAFDYISKDEANAVNHVEKSIKEAISTLNVNQEIGTLNKNKKKELIRLCFITTFIVLTIVLSFLF